MLDGGVGAASGDCWLFAEYDEGYDEKAGGEAMEELLVEMGDV